jgi:hypothetical protein
MSPGGRILVSKRVLGGKTRLCALYCKELSYSGVTESTSHHIGLA